MVQLKTRLSDGRILELTVPDTATFTVEELKNLISATSGDSKAGMRLVYKGKILQDDEDTLDKYKINGEDTLHVAKARTSNVSETLSAPSSSGMNDLLTNNPLLKSLASNKTFIQTMLSENPRYKQMAEEYPELKEALNDPAFLESIAKGASDPNIMRELLRNQDLAISNIESIPGGFNKLSSLYKKGDILSDTPDTSTEEANRRFAQSLGVTSPTSSKPNTMPLPNPWAPRPQMPPMMPAGPPNPFMNPLSAMGSTSPFAHQPFGFPNMYGNPFGFPTSSLSPLSSVNVPGTTPAPLNYNPEDFPFKKQLEDMRLMGFNNDEQNKKALLAVGGNLDAAIAYLLDQ